MIENLTIKDQGSFDNDGVFVKDLKEINYFYGANGSGKTTISRVIEKLAEYPNCSISWKSGKPLMTMVYNRDFVDLNFNPSTDLKGVFTLGEKDAGLLAAIEKAVQDKEALDAQIVNLEETRKTKSAHLSQLEEAFKEDCWLLKVKYEANFKPAFTGYMGTKTAFKEKMVSALENMAAAPIDIDTLKNEAETVFSNSLELIQKLEFHDSTKLAECQNDPILEKKVIGKEDIDISNIIKKLGNSDWVKQGRDYFDKNDGICPFCQQETDDEFAVALGEYFDEAYMKDMADIVNLIERYDQYSQNILSYIDAHLAAPSKYLDVDALSTMKKNIASELAVNKALLQTKRREASSVVKLQDLSTALMELTAFTKSVNDLIGQHNAKVENIATVKKDLTAKVWRALAEEQKAKFTTHNASAFGFKKAVESTTNEITNKSISSTQKDQEIKDLEAKITSIQPTINAINKLLASFGFTGFKLAKSNKDGCYEIVRPDGSEAKHTLSEGEKTFITFLYFFHLLRGSNSAGGISDARIVVLDDPISSLDSDILFIVSNLIKSLIASVQKNEGSVKQLFILTHNIYFHKEITFNSKRSKNLPFKEETFWVVRKRMNISSIDYHKENPIRTSYELLWSEIRSEKKNNNSIQNTLRRIIENYFKIMGGIDIDSIIDGFEGGDKILCRSLFSWVNDGSHFSGDDLYMNCDDDKIDRFMLIFKHIFKLSGHMSHYYMMMGISEANDVLEELYKEEAA